MIVSIGTDLIEVARLRQTLTRTPRFRERVFTPAEQAYCDGRGEKVAAQHYAARFAAKEATLKALGTGWRGDLSWIDIEITSDALGAPRLLLHGAALYLSHTLGTTHTHLTLSHTREHAIAYVIFEKVE